MDRRRHPSRAKRNAGLFVVGILITICVGVGASNYTVANINPIYFDSIGTRSPRAVASGTESAGTMSASSATFPGMPGDQYYHYRPPPVTASYDAASRFEKADVDSPAEPDRSTGDRAGNLQEGSPAMVANEPARDDTPLASASKPVPASADVDEGVVERIQAVVPPGDPAPPETSPQ